MIKYNYNSMNESIDTKKLIKISNELHDKYDSWKICELVSKVIARNSDLKVLMNFMMYYSPDNMERNHHVVNINKDKSIIYDFTGNQYGDRPDGGTLWMYKKINERLYLSKDGELSDLPKNMKGVDLDTISGELDFVNKFPKYRIITLTDESKIL